jgi:hypothetical protein
MSHPAHVHSRPRRRARIVALAAVGALALGAAGCGSSDDASSSTTTKAPAPSTTSVDASDNAVTVSTPGMAFDVSGPLRPGVATLTLQNDDDVSHMMAMVPLKDGVTLDQFRDALAKGEDEATKLLAGDPEQTAYGTPAPVGPGASSTTTMVDLPAGHYALVCFFTSDDGTPHFQQGMIGELTVEGEEVTAEPDSDGRIEISDDGITLPDGFDGHGTFEVTNTGTTPHSISFAALDEGTTLDDFYQAEGQAQATGTSMDVDGGSLAGGVDNLLPGQSTYLVVDLDAGHYGYVSISDAEGPEMPAQHGEFDVS